MNNLLSIFKDMLHGQIYMHTAFWGGWLCPMLVAAQVEYMTSLPVGLIYLPYLGLSTTGAWRSTRNPPGALWVAMLYKIALGFFVLTVISYFALWAYALYNG